MSARNFRRAAAKGADGDEGEEAWAETLVASVRQHTIGALCGGAWATHCLGMSEGWEDFEPPDMTLLMAEPSILEADWFRGDDDGDSSGRGGGGPAGGSSDRGSPGYGRNGAAGGGGGDSNGMDGYSRAGIHRALVEALANCTEVADAGLPCQQAQLDIGKMALRYSHTPGDDFHKLAMSALVAAMIASETDALLACGGVYIRLDGALTMPLILYRAVRLLSIPSKLVFHRKTDQAETLAETFRASMLMRVAAKIACSGGRPRAGGRRRAQRQQQQQQQQQQFQNGGGAAGGGGGGSGSQGGGRGSVAPAPRASRKKKAASKKRQGKTSPSSSPPPPPPLPPPTAPPPAYGLRLGRKQLQAAHDVFLVLRSMLDGDLPQHRRPTARSLYNEILV